MMNTSREELLVLSGVRTELHTSRGAFAALDSVDLTIREGEAVGIVGESGSGKTMTALSIMGLIPPRVGGVVAGEIRYRGTDLAALSPAERPRFRGREIGMIFQDPVSFLNPVLTIGDQLGETVRLHFPDEDPRRRVLEVLDMVGLPRGSRIERRYPHELSGGMKQRVLIALAVVCRPRLLIADEPTTALDVTIQAQILDLLRDLREELNAALVVITHDLGVVAELCDRVAVMYAGRIVEQAEVATFFEQPRHPYPRGLLRSVKSISEGAGALYSIAGSVPDAVALPSGCSFHPRCPLASEICRVRTPELRLLADGTQVACHHAEEAMLPVGLAPAVASGAVQGDAPATAAVATGAVAADALLDAEADVSGGALLELRGVTKDYLIGGAGLLARRDRLRAVNEVDIQVAAGETVALVGESGSGKSTIGRLALGLIERSDGEILFDGAPLPVKGPALKALRRDAQMIFQNPHSSLNPRKSVGAILRQAVSMGTPRARVDDRVEELLEQVGLSPASSFLDRHPHELSGGQRQRVGIARALSCHPRLVVADEPLSALDMSVQAQILKLLKELQENLGVAYLMITHNLVIAESMADRVVVLYLGRVVESGPAREVMRSPRHPYTMSLKAAEPVLNPAARSERRLTLRGDIPSAAHPPSGCAFRTRCPFVQDRCAAEVPEAEVLDDGRTVACHFVDEIAAGQIAPRTEEQEAQPTVT